MTPFTEKRTPYKKKKVRWLWQQIENNVVDDGDESDDDDDDDDDDGDYIRQYLIVTNHSAAKVTQLWQNTSNDV